MKTTILAPVEPRKMPVQQRSRIRFERILDQALRLIVGRGVDTVPMSEIATAAEISVASLYQYFPEKAAIVATLADRFNQEGQECVQGCFAKVKKAEDLLQAFVDMLDGYYEFFRDVPGSYEIWQATQSDTRLQQIDTNDMELHAKTIGAGMQKVLPKLSSSESLTLGRMLGGVVAHTVRTASTLSEEEASLMLEACKNCVLAPSLGHLLNHH